MFKSLAGILAFVLCCLLSFGQDRSKKAYELIYEDIQVLKRQLLVLEEKLDRNAADIESLKTQVRDLQSLMKLLQSDQGSLQDGLKNVPSQYQFLLDKIEQANRLLAKISEDLLTMKGGLAPAPVPRQEAKEKPATPRRSNRSRRSPPRHRFLPRRSIIRPMPITSGATSTWLPTGSGYTATASRTALWPIMPSTGSGNAYSASENSARPSTSSTT